MKKEIQNINITIKFPYRVKIRRDANLIEDMFSDFYLQPTVMPIPDEIEPMIPRITLNSKNGHSIINFNQIGIDFMVNFDDQYRYDYDKCETYIRHRMTKLHEYLISIEMSEIYYIGITTQIRFVIEDSMNEIEELKQKYLSTQEVTNLYDYNEKITLLEGEEYFENITIGNFRDFNGNIINGHIPAIVSFEKAQVAQKGFFVVLDINNRYKYTMKGDTTPIDQLEVTFEHLYSKNRNWISDKMLTYLPDMKEE